MVVLYHTSHYLAVARGGPAMPGSPLLGLYGVSIFFAISGYLMATLVPRSDPWTFLAHRVVRIYPALLLATALYLLAFKLLSQPLGFDVVAITLVPAGPRFYPLGIEWTLLFEVTFYVGLYGLALVRATDRLELLALAWLLVIAIRLVAFPGSQDDPTPPLQRLVPMQVCTGFALGLLIPAALRLGLVPRWAWAAGAATVVVFVAIGVGNRPWLAGLGSAILVAGVVRVDRASRPRRFDVFKALGDASYGIYLIHVPALRLAFEFAPPHLSGPVVWTCGFIAALLAGIVLGAVDLRLYGLAKRVVDRAGMAPVRACITLYVVAFGGVAAYGMVDTARQERRSEQVRVVVARLPPTSLLDRDAAARAIEAAGLARPSLRGEVAQVQVGAGTLVLSGWAADDEDPKRDLAVVVFHRGAQVGSSRPTRVRTGVADRLGRPALAEVRTGFGVGVASVPCEAAGDLVSLALDLTGGAASVLAAPPSLPRCK